MQFPAWPESEYLVRVAAGEPLLVAEIVQAMPATDNSRIVHDVIQIAAAVPAEIAAGLVPKVTEGLDSRFGTLIPQAGGELLVHLCRGGHADAATDLAGALLQRLPASPGPAADADDYGYGVILREHVPAWAALAGTAALRLLCRSLAEVTRADAERHGKQPGQDGSPFWRPSISGKAGRPDTDLRDALIDAVRDAAASIAWSRPGGINDVVTELESHRWLIFRRLALDLLSQVAGQACDLVAARLTDAAVVAEWGLGREYLLLARSGAACLDAAHLRRFLTLIDRGPAFATADPAAPQTKAENQEPLVAERVARWQRDRLAAVQQILPPEWDARYQALVAEHGEAPDPTATIPAPFAVRSLGSPITAGELSAMPTSSLVEFLRTWQPPAAPGWPVWSPASLRGAISTVIQNDAASRSADADSFIGLPAVYVGAVINGLWQASAQGSSPDWYKVLQLSAWISRQADDELAGSIASQPQREWREARTDMLRLLMTGLNPGPAPIPPANDEQVWSIIRDSCDDPDPSAEREADRTDEEPAAFWSLALTTVRAQAIRAAITYGLRLRRRSPDTDRTQVHVLLERHLDWHIDPSLAVRSIYGELFPQLAWMDPDWTQRHVQLIFPADPGQRALLDAASDAYLAGATVTRETWLLLAGTYGVMAGRAHPSGQGRAEKFRASYLGAHLITALWHGWPGAESHGGLMRQFYAGVSPEVASELMWLIGNSLRSAQTPDPTLITRLMSFWEFRVTAVRNGADADELKEFGCWFASGHFAATWSLRQLLTALTHADGINAEGAVLSRLADLAPDQIQTSLTALEQIISTITEPWRLGRSRDDIRRIMNTAVGAGPTAVQTATKIVSILLLEHGIDLRDILYGETPADRDPPPQPPEG